jgi:hypothetical protein
LRQAIRMAGYQAIRMEDTACTTSPLICKETGKSSLDQFTARFIPELFHQVLWKECQECVLSICHFVVQHWHVDIVAYIDGDKPLSCILCNLTCRWCRHVFTSTCGSTSNPTHSSLQMLLHALAAEQWPIEPIEITHIG